MRGPGRRKRYAVGLRRLSLLVGLLGAVSTAVGSGAAVGQSSPVNDLFALGQGFGQTLTTAPVLRRAEPLPVASAAARCDAASNPEPGIQGRVTAGSAAGGRWCNMSLLGHQGTSGGFKVYRYVDRTGRECAYYDTTLLYPLNALNPAGTSPGVAVLDMSDPAHPVQTDTLTELPMLSPHESLNVNTARGLVAAVNGNPATAPGLVSIYDAHADCRHPVLQSTSLVARFGHESGFAPDGRTFYATGTALPTVTAIDVTDPKTPHPIWEGNIAVHGMSLSDDGNRAYAADPLGHDMLILDTSEIQARKPNPQARELSRLTWAWASIPQNAIPFTVRGKPYVLEFDEYTASTANPGGGADQVGAARIIDTSDETQPHVISNLRLQVNQPADHHAAAGDPGASSPVQGYAAHYCNLPTRVDPTLVACSFITSGLRLFDISDLTRPREVAYFLAPTKPAITNGFMASDYAMSQPAFVPDRREIWYSDGATGFYAVHVDAAAWPQRAVAAARVCGSRRRLLVRARVPRGAQIASVRASLNGRAVRVVRRRGVVYAVVDLRGRTVGAARLVIRVRLRSGRVLTARHFYHPCVRRTPAVR